MKNLEIKVAFLLGKSVFVNKYEASFISLLEILRMEKRAVGGWGDISYFRM